ncbi:hypothetical protein M3Y96_00278100 [Aphelenchoides besseyi]|nr:hypothetical protein M3Y96_00278100 [Aphelenchoides besseyi]
MSFWGDQTTVIAIIVVMSICGFLYSIALGLIFWTLNTQLKSNRKQRESLDYSCKRVQVQLVNGDSETNELRTEIEKLTAELKELVDEFAMQLNEKYAESQELNVEMDRLLESLEPSNFNDSKQTLKSVHSPCVISE